MAVERETLEALAEASARGLFDEGKHRRGPGGKFASKGGTARRLAGSTPLRPGRGRHFDQDTPEEFATRTQVSQGRQEAKAGPQAAAVQRLEAKRWGRGVRQADVLDDLVAADLSTEGPDGPVDSLNSPLARMIHELGFYDVTASRVFQRVTAKRSGATKDPVRQEAGKVAAKSRKRGYSSRYGPPPMYD